jgi:hypothetical protein
MNITWSPYVPVYPNDKVPYNSQVDKLRVIEPATRAAVEMNPIDDWVDRLEKLIELQRQNAIAQYDNRGQRVVTPATGTIVDLIL